MLAEHDDELVLTGGSEVFRLPLAPSGSDRLALLVRALPVLRSRVPVAVAPPRWVGVLPDGETPFTAESRLPGRPPGGPLESIAEAQQWGVPGVGPTLVSPGLGLLADGPRLTGTTGWRLRLDA